MPLMIINAYKLKSELNSASKTSLLNLIKILYSYYHIKIPTTREQGPKAEHRYFIMHNRNFLYTSLGHDANDVTCCKKTVEIIKFIQFGKFDSRFIALYLYLPAH